MHGLGGDEAKEKEQKKQGKNEEKHQGLDVPAETELIGKIDFHLQCLRIVVRHPLVRVPGHDLHARHGIQGHGGAVLGDDLADLEVGQDSTGFRAGTRVLDGGGQLAKEAPRQSLLAIPGWQAGG